MFKKLYQNGWITDEEFASRNSSDTQTKLNNYSKKIDMQRKGVKPTNNKKS